jgi:hypothetical protein
MNHSVIFWQKHGLLHWNFFWSGLQINKSLVKELNVPSIKLGVWKFRLLVEPYACRLNTLQVIFAQIIPDAGNGMCCWTCNLGTSMKSLHVCA